MAGSDRVASALSARSACAIYTIRDRLLASLDGETTAGGRAIVLTAAHAGEGVTYVAARLWVALGQANRGPVLLCEANTEAPDLAQRLGVSPAPGLGEVLSGQCTLEQAVQAAGPENLFALTAGRQPPPPQQYVESRRFRDLLAALRNAYAFTLFDAPAVLDCSAAARLAGMADAAALVVESEREPWEVVENASALLRAAGAHLIGAVLNKRRYHIPRFLYRRL